MELTKKQIGFINKVYDNDDICKYYKNEIEHYFSDVINKKPDVFKDYNKGDICVWEGDSPAIFRIKGFHTSSECCYSTTHYYDSMHYSNMRHATEFEKKILGRREIFIVNK